MLAIDVGRLRNGWVRTFDLGVFDQAAWLLAHGHAHVSLIQRNVFADHVSPVLVLFAPLYRLRPTVLWLLGAQAAAVGATVVPVRRLAAAEGVSTTLAPIGGVASPPVP